MPCHLLIHSFTQDLHKCRLRSSIRGQSCTSGNLALKDTKLSPKMLPTCCNALLPFRARATVIPTIDECRLAQ